MSGKLYITEVTEAMSKTNYPKNISPIGTPLKTSPPRLEKRKYGTLLYHHANFHANRQVSKF